MKRISYRAGDTIVLTHDIHLQLPQDFTKRDVARARKQAVIKAIQRVNELFDNLDFLES